MPSLTLDCRRFTFMDLTSINEHLQENQATYDAFNQLRQKDPALAQECFFVLEELLIKHGDYARCLEYLGDPDAAFAQIKRTYDTGKQYEQRLEKVYGNLIPKTADRKFIDQTRQLILILVKTANKPKAEHIRDQALALLDDPLLKSAVSDAEQKLARQ